VNFIDDEDLETAAGREILDVFAQLPDILDAGIRCSVDFKDVDGIAGGYFVAGRAGIAGLRHRSPLALKRLGKNPRRARLTDAPGAGKQKRMGDPAGFDGILQCPAHMFLTNEVTERLRPPFSR